MTKGKLSNAEEKKLREDAPGDEIGILMRGFREATLSVERDLALEDANWINLSGATSELITDASRILNLRLSRLYATRDPLGKQSIRLWTDYTFGRGMVWSVAEDNKEAKKALEAFWGAKENQGLLSSRGQRKSSDKVLIDGEIFFAIFLGASKDVPTIRRIDPLEILEIITDIDDKEKVLYYKRQWSDARGTPHTEYYRDTTNLVGLPGVDSSSTEVQKTDDALIYHLTMNTTSQRGNPLLLPALLWMKYHTKFLSSRIAIMLALAKFAWKSKVKGGTAAVSGIRATTHDKEIEAGSHMLENMGVDTTPIKTDTGASKAYQDGRMLKLMIFAGVGFPEQYFADISTGNLATAKTVELPIQKMIESNQQVWNDTYQDIDEIVLEHAGIPEDKWHVDRVFPPVTPLDVVAVADAIVKIVGTFPEFGETPDVQQQALLAIGINDPAAVLEELTRMAEKNPSVALTKALKQLRKP